ncbi:MAG: hypothetical protein L6416_01525 [Candidatus Omnitrophica bacterium]|nr:hypothetical protein [Candidatus Omnitrophota bacterium]
MKTGAIKRRKLRGQSSEKVTYEIDPYNRLVINKNGKKSELSRFRQVLDGRFKTDENNTVYYHIKAPMPQGTDIPYQVKLQGKWSLRKTNSKPALKLVV